MEKALKRRRKRKTFEETAAWLTPAYVREQIGPRIRDPALTVSGVAQQMVDFLVSGMADARRNKKTFLIGGYKLPHEHLDYFLALLLKTLRGIAGGSAGGSAAGSAGGAAGSSTNFVKSTLTF